jgi:hypothetical protein
LILLLGLATPAWAAEEPAPVDLRLRLEACQAETTNLREIAQKYRVDDLAGDIRIAELLGQRDALYQEVQRLRQALGIARPDTKEEAK